MKYSEEDGFYDQGFEKKGFVSVWLGLNACDEGDDCDVLQDKCGVGYYQLDNQESNNYEFTERSVAELLSEISYSPSFIAEVEDAAAKRGVGKARWVLVQYDFDYRTEGVSRPIFDDPVFIGSFPYSSENE